MPYNLQYRLVNPPICQLYYYGLSTKKRDGMVLVNWEIDLAIAEISGSALFISYQISVLSVL